MTITEGQTVPEFSLPDQDGTTVTSAQLRGGWAVVYFYPKDDTPGCTAESCSFRDNFEAFTDAGAKVIGIFGLTDPAKTGPLGDGHRIFAAAGVEARRDIARDSSRAAELLHSIEPSSVIAAALEMLGASG